MLLQKHEYQAIIRLKQAPDPYRRLVVSIRCEWLSAKDKMPDTLCCILFKNYIKPQRRRRTKKKVVSCILFKNYIKPQPPTASLSSA